MPQLPKTSRRLVLAGAGAAAFAAPTSPSAPDIFPRHDLALAKEIVLVSHNNLDKVKELLGIRPALANAAWESGFGDWESALGAASHMGRRDIAELLINNGASPTLFSAAMMGQLDVVKALIAARPGSEKLLGPHSIPLLSHARAGGAPAAAVVEYLQAIGNASGLKVVEISEEELAKLAGEYTYGGAAAENFRILQKGKQLSFQRGDSFGKPIHHVGAKVFRPAGAPGVRLEFDETSSGLVIKDGELVLKAVKKRT
jgi:hypothetical protein